MSIARNHGATFLLGRLEMAIRIAAACNSASIGPLPTITQLHPGRAAFTLRNASIKCRSPFSGRNAHTTPITAAVSSPHGSAARSPSGGTCRIQPVVGQPHH